MYEVYTSTNVLYRRNITYIQRNIFFVAIFLRPRIRWERPLMQTRTKQQQSMNCKKEKIKTKKTYSLRSVTSITLECKMKKQKWWVDEKVRRQHRKQKADLVGAVERDKEPAGEKTKKRKMQAKSNIWL